MDHIAYALCSGSRKRKNRIYFPIADSNAKYEENKADWTRGMSKEAKAKLDKLKPYKGGNDALWRLHKLNNIDKHRLLITADCCFPSLDIGSFMRQSMPGVDQETLNLLPSFYLGMKEPVPLRNGEILMVDLPNATVKAITARFVIRITESEVVAGENLYDVIAGCVETVTGIVESFAPLL